MTDDYDDIILPNIDDMLSADSNSEFVKEQLRELKKIEKKHKRKSSNKKCSDKKKKELSEINQCINNKTSLYELDIDCVFLDSNSSSNISFEIFDSNKSKNFDEDSILQYKHESGSHKLSHSEDANQSISQSNKKLNIEKINYETPIKQSINKQINESTPKAINNKILKTEIQPKDVREEDKQASEKISEIINGRQKRSIDKVNRSINISVDTLPLSKKRKCKQTNDPLRFIKNPVNTPVLGLKIGLSRRSSSLNSSELESPSFSKSNIRMGLSKRVPIKNCLHPELYQHT